MKKEKMYAILCYIVSVCFYLAAVINFWSRDRMGILWLCLGSMMLCFGGVLINKMNKKDEDK